MTNKQVCETFINSKGEKSAHSNNVHCYGTGRIFSYGTHFIMGEWKDGKLTLTTRKYSVTTSKQMSLLRSAAVRAGIQYTEAELR